LGLNENRVPQFRQKPSVSPGLPSRSRPTGWSQPLQYRLLSGTRGSASTALAGSRDGTGGISTRPAPRRPRADRPEVRRDLERELRLPESGPDVPDDPDQADPAVPEEGTAAEGAAAASPQVSQ
jgi:hypothetical protein